LRGGHPERPWGEQAERASRVRVGEVGNAQVAIAGPSQRAELHEQMAE
jgi:hypothetical protein